MLDVDKPLKAKDAQIAITMGLMTTASMTMDATYTVTVTVALTLSSGTQILVDVLLVQVNTGKDVSNVTMMNVLRQTLAITSIVAHLIMP